MSPRSRRRAPRVSWSFLAAVLLASVVGPAVVVFSVLCAAAAHECGHLFALRVFRVPVERFRLTAFGAELYARGAQRLSYGRELIVMLAGCVVNFFCAVALALISARFAWAGGFVFAGAHLLLGAFNLLPVPPLDGSRVLYLAVAFFFGPRAGDVVSAFVGALLASALLAAAVLFCARTGGGFFFLFAACALFPAALRQLALAKMPISV